MYPYRYSKFLHLHVNCRSIRKNFSSLLELLGCMNVQPSAIAITETWLGEGEGDFFSLPGYDLISVPRQDRGGGGVGLYIGNSFSYNAKLDAIYGSPTYETVIVDVIKEGWPVITLISMYRPENDIISFHLAFDNLMNMLMCNNNLILIGCDLNIDLLRVHDHTLVNDFFNILISNHLYPTITRPTRITESSATLIDNIFVRYSNVNHHILSSIVFHDLSDHLPVFVLLQFNSIYTENIVICKKRFFTVANTIRFSQLIHNVDWSFVSPSVLCPNILYNSFLCKFTEIFEKCFPLQTLQLKSKNNRCPPPWLTPALITSCRRKSDLFKKYKKSCTAYNRLKYITYRNKLKSTLLAAEKMFYATQFIQNSNNANKTWQTIKQIINRNKKGSLPNTFVTNGGEISDPHKKKGMNSIHILGVWEGS